MCVATELDEVITTVHVHRHRTCARCMRLHVHVQPPVVVNQYGYKIVMYTYMNRETSFDLTYSSGQNKVDVHPAYNDCATVIALKQNAKRTEHGNAFTVCRLTRFLLVSFLHHLYSSTHMFFIRSAFVFSRAEGNNQVPKPLLSLAKCKLRLSGSTGYV